MKLHDHPVPQRTEAIRFPARSRSSGSDRDLAARWAERLRESRRAFTALVLELPPVYREFLLDGDLDGPRLGHRWPLVQLDACFRRLSRYAPVQNDPAIARIMAEAGAHKRKIDIARRALLLANLRLAIRVGKPQNGRDVAKLKRQLAALS